MTDEIIIEQLELQVPDRITEEERSAPQRLTVFAHHGADA